MTWDGSWRVGQRMVVRFRGEDGLLYDRLGDVVRADATRVELATRQGAAIIERSRIEAAKPVPAPPVRRVRRQE